MTAFYGRRGYDSLVPTFFVDGHTFFHFTPCIGLLDFLMRLAMGQGKATPTR